MTERGVRPLFPVFVALSLTAPWLAVSATGLTPGPVASVALSGTSILGAAFLLAWAAETAEKDVSRSFAIAVLAVLAVAPEYAVDALYAWEAGIAPATTASREAADLAVANMTGANRILIGIGWSGIVLFTIARTRRVRDRNVEHVDGFLADRVHLDRELSLEIVFLFVATVYAFFIPATGSIALHDMVVLVGLYALYILAAIRTPPTEEASVGVPAYLQSFRKPYRISTVIALFVFSGATILLAVEPFAHGLEELGLQYGIQPFLMIQWVAPLASETPEFIIVVLLVTKARSNAAFNALISSKLNQWTLLIGTLVLVYSVSLGNYGALPLGTRQAGEIWLTAAQSYFAISLLIDLRISAREALVLLSLFLVQLHPTFHRHEWLLAFTALYLVLGTALLVRRFEDVRRVMELARKRVHGASVKRERD
ncbi:Na+/Ca2+-exchanging protein [Natrialba asiatica]|uniref:Na+/Ca2+-exchanging protein n=1 Tax=Natrialba asiatica (strain ATCC 700177 / DSM 12278 / JCM 9576 / FERM P-10747 / NBRC 102637 / 172P1) TaxID=29540 RepID=M0AN17_NATA1|nr:Na+/Ca2+-exchanging protein [Natrialba asiatica]ELY99322.1 Na+/Ca2+-exchanging protein [Natrialba asiatica DSM 12278]